MPGREIEVLLTTEGTYPVSQGGVSTWCDLLARRVRGVRYTVMTIMANPFLPARYPTPPSIRGWVKVPLWGVEDPFEYMDANMEDLVLRRQRTTEAVVRERFLPVLGRVLDAFWSPPEEPKAGLRADLVQLHELFLEYDYLTLMKDPAVWRWYTESALERYAPRFGLRPTLHDLVQSMGWAYRFLSVLNSPVPQVDVVHSSAAAFCALPGIVARTTRGVPFLLTEHGVYLREQYHNIGRAALSPYLKRSLLGMTQTISQAAYAAADVVAPVAAFNTRWELELAVPQHKVRVTYNGVDPAVFQPRPRPEGQPPTVVSVARIDPVKDQETLLHAAAEVVAGRPDVRFVVYGGVSVPAYYEELLQLRAELGLEERFVFAGHLADVPAAYASGDVVALSSRTEGFPYAVIEAMMCERPVVATDVGGTREALGDTGLLVPARSPRAMAAAILRLLDDPAAAQAMAEEARERALSRFTVNRFVEDHEQLYRELAGRTAPRLRERVRLVLDRSRALVAAGFYDVAETFLAETIRAAPAGSFRALLMYELARVQMRLRKVEAARLSLEKARVLADLERDPAA